MTELLSVQSLKVNIAGRDVCDSLDLTINAGESWGILGINGVGKTTLLHTLAGLRHQAHGSISYLQTNTQTLNLTELAKMRGVLFQSRSDPFPATVLETVLTGRHPYIKNWQWETDKDIELAKQALQQVDLIGMENRYINTLSGGERQRVAIATLLTQQPDVYLLDEPTNHLDVQHQMHLMQLLRETSTHRKSALVMILHDLNLVTRFCDHVVMLFGNGKVLVGESSALLTEDRLEELYGYPINIIEHDSRQIFLPT